ncbi:MAG TPA: hypothetical protein VFH88_14735 [Candidatus Krumholzibacteria bacterium]|nr:hypothetical protein [Candidatus Krumholzibacteria bacterium]
MARYVEMVIHGNDRDLKGYLTGYLNVSKPPRIVYADEGGFQLHRLRERIKHRGEVQHLIVEEENEDRLRKALKAAGPRYDFEIKDERIVETGVFSFEFDTPSRKVADQLKHLFDEMPVGTVLKDYEPHEETSGRDAGTEIYTPAHDYKFSGHGEIRGDLFAVVDMRATLDAIDFTKCDEILIEDDSD